jgi:ketosteroid isomerase-like protein
MKICPQCQNTYTDDSLQFCLQDGTPLNFQTSTLDWTESETVVSPKNRQSNNTQNLPTQEWQQTPVTNTLVQTSPPKSNKSKVLLLVSLALLLFLSIVGVGTWILITNMKKEIAQTNSNKPFNNQSLPTNTKQVNTNNPATPTPTPTATPTPKPTLKPEDAAKAKAGVENTIEGWKNASQSHDIDGHLSYYADTVDYYNGGKVSLSKVRADKQKAYDMYDSINVSISNVVTTIDDSGEKATSIFDKEWTFENDEKTNSGKVRQQLQFTKIGGEWRITSEKDLKVYYVNK